MATLLFFTGPMDCGKSTLALQVDYTQAAGGRLGRLLTAHDRSGEGRITSRIGLSSDAIEVDATFDVWSYVVQQLTSGHRIDYLICDEAQFYTASQVDQLARIVDELGIDVFAFGILTDFRTQLFPGARRLVEMADRLELLPVQPLCWCGARGTHNARTVDGRMVTEGEQVVVGDTRPEGEVGYEVLCRRHHRRGVTRAVAGSTLNVDPLPFTDEADSTDPAELIDEPGATTETIAFDPDDAIAAVPDAEGADDNLIADETDPDEEDL